MRFVRVLLLALLTARLSSGAWAAGNANYPSMVLGAHFQGANNSTTFPDVAPTPKTLTAVSGAKITTGVNDPFGASTGVLILNGSSDYITIPDSVDWDLTGDFLIRFHVYFTGYSASYSGSYGSSIIANYKSGTGNLGWQVRINGTSSSYTTINVYTGSTDLNFTITGGLSLNTWYEVEVNRTSGNIRAFAAGTQAGSTTANTDTFTKTLTGGVGGAGGNGGNTVGAYPAGSTGNNGSTGNSGISIKLIV